LIIVFDFSFVFFFTSTLPFVCPAFVSMFTFGWRVIVGRFVYVFIVRFFNFLL
jgi:hypothetical protein